MVDMAQEAIQAYLASNPAEAEAVSSAPLDAFVADASCIDEYGGAAALLSVFGLQQMGPVAPQALASWVRNVAPGGLAVVVLWPSKADPNGPWGAFDQVVLERAAAVAGKPPPPPNAAATAPAANWEMDLTGPALRDVAGAELLVDRLEQHSMVWESAMQLWKVMTEGGPWRARRLAQGEKVMNDLEARFLAKMAAKEEEQQLHLNGGYEQRPHLLEHHPFARVIVIRRKDVSCGTELAAMQQPQPAEVPLTEQLIGEGGRATASPKTCVRPHPQSTL
ncbi:hypothetical protein Vretimale_5010 [Volvox reticuliferus]|uniref:Uncharacterized protein n=1 Tax=Volvox reticuliferus TaxID=1737510 RepID=A0A8J4DGV2_9CHLO|nr:hypothetical protein Vretimale_5010 [Volvox reticuliferus]